jgi:hypothetical protein
MFCRECGSKLDHSKLKLDEVSKKARAGAKSERGGGGSKTLKVLEVLVGLALIGAVAALFWPVKSIGEVGEPATAQELEEKLVRLKDACENNIELQMMLNEGEINAYLAKLVEDSGSLSEDGPSLEEVNFLIEQGHMEVYLKTKIGPLPLAYRVQGEPSAGRGSFSFVVNEARIGMVKVPANFRDKFVVSKVARVFSGLEDERFILTRVNGFDLAQAKIRVTTPGE